MSSDADKFAQDDTKHDLCDERPCNECTDWGICPRCGEWKLNLSSIVLNAMARRHRNGRSTVWICSDCGTEEAFEDAGMTQRKEWFKEVA